MSYLDDLFEQREALTAAIEATIAEAQANGGMSDDQKGQIETRNAEIKRLDGEIEIIGGQQTAIAKANEFASKFLRGVAPKPVEQRNAAPVESTGSAFVKSDEFRSYDFHGATKRFEISEPDRYETRAPITTADLPINKTIVSVAEPTAATPLFGLVGSEQIAGGSFEYVSYAFTNNAAVVPEGTLKPESLLDSVITPGTLDTIAHWTQVTRQALEDSARIRSIIDGKLIEGVNKKVHDSIVAALVAAVLPTAAGDTLLAAIRNGVGTVQAAGFAPNAVLLNPMDWAALDIILMQDTLNGAVRSQSFWGMTPVASVDQPLGTATVGDFKAGATLFYKSGVGVFATDSHAETFTSNVFTILAERRSKAAVVNPSALVECTATPVIP